MARTRSEIWWMQLLVYCFILVIAIFFSRRGGKGGRRVARATVSAETTLDVLMPITSLDLGASISSSERGGPRPSRSGLLRTPKTPVYTN